MPNIANHQTLAIPAKIGGDVPLFAACVHSDADTAARMPQDALRATVDGKVGVLGIVGASVAGRAKSKRFGMACE